tara:strand:- start:1555 stop:2850 length:1296 start_codon:yes stop_codon:yes gene_type:complete
MIPRYSRKKMANIWEPLNKFNIWLDIECHACDKMADLGIIPKSAASNIRKKAKFDLDRISELEKKTKHDVIAFLTNVSESVGSDGRFLHQGMTSSDILDTTLSLQLKQSAEIIIEDIKKILDELKIHAIKHKLTPIIGRSHGVHAEVTTFGLKIAGFYAEFKRNLQRMKNAKNEISTCAISGPVGNFSSINPKIEKYVAKKLGLIVEPVSTQIIPRDRHAVFFNTLGVIASSVERIATEIRNLQRTEILEVAEYFDQDQKGSSAMPHKKNPILSENITGIARYIRSVIIPALENITLWHERDISHSSVERIIAPDSTIATDFILTRLKEIIKNLNIYPDNMKKNIDKYKDVHKSQSILLALTQKNISRERAYEIVQEASKKTMSSNLSFMDSLLKFKECKNNLGKKKISQILKAENYKKEINYIYKRIFND